MPEYRVTAKVSSEFRFTIDTSSEEDAREIVESNYPASHFHNGETCLVGINSMKMVGCSEVEVREEGEFEILEVEEVD